MASGGRFNMSIPRAFIEASLALALTSVTFFRTSASGQSLAAGLNSTVAVSEPKSSAENRVAAEDPKPKDLQSEIEAVKTESSEVRELLRKMEEQQKTLLERVDRLQQRLDGAAATHVSIAGQPIVPTTAAASVPAANAVAAPQTDDRRYRDGMVIWETRQHAKVPFLLKFNVNTQLRYLNTLDSNETFTDHLGVARDVHTRNDITVNRSMFILGGYIFDKRALYSVTV